STGKTEVFARRCGLRLIRTLTEVSLEWDAQALDRCFIVDGERVARKCREFRFTRRVRSRAFGAAYAANGAEHVFTHVIVERAHVELERGVVRNDVFLCAGLQRTNRQHGTVT